MSLGSPSLPTDLDPATMLISWTVRIAKFLRVRVQQNFARFNADRQAVLWGLAVLIGLAVGLAAIGFRELIGWVQFFWIGSTTEFVVTAAMGQHPVVLVLGPTLGGFLVGYLVNRYLIAKRPAAIADVIEARAAGGRGLNTKNGLISAGVTILSLGCGASTGREGPVVHLGATLATKISRGLKLHAAGNRLVLACGAAAAVSASFNAPIAGALFAHEVILGHYALSAVIPIILASVIAAVCSHLWFGDVAAFIIPSYEIRSYLEIPAFVLLGVLCAVVAALFQFCLTVSDQIIRAIDVYLPIKTMIGGFILGLVALIYPEVLGVGYETTDNALKGNFSFWLMVQLIIAKTAMTAMCLAVRFGGGVFSPSLYLGALTGGAFGIAAASLVPEAASSTGLYALIGMGAVTASVLGAPISTVMIVFELTGGFALSVALLLTVSVAVGVCQMLYSRSFFHDQLEQRGVMITDGNHTVIMQQIRVFDFMTEASEEAAKIPFETGSGLPYLKPSDSLEGALKAFDNSGHARIAVVDAADPTRVIGEVQHLRALRYYNRALVQASVEEHH